jgi:hypothetical protein
LIKPNFFGVVTTTSLVGLLVLVWFVKNIPSRLAMIIGYLSVVALFATFALALDNAKTYRAKKEFRYTLTTSQGADLKAKVVRSGDRGVLFYEESDNQLVLLPWNRIAKLTSGEAGSPGYPQP